VRTLRTTSHLVNDAHVITLSGHLDTTSAAQFRHCLTQIDLNDGARLVLDLSELTFCDSSGITALITARHHAHANQTHLALAAVPTHITRILHVVGLEQFFTTHPTVETATADSDHNTKL
jgi:anti-sigma B factor antagonist